MLEDDVIVELGHGRAEVAVELAVLHRDDTAIERGEDRDSDVHLAKASEVRVGARVAVVRLRAAREVTHAL
ncbi:MAG TPA: hypothetical protein VFU84_11000, partial [Gaiellaceae bacterium]|nr:hypothetical protein [Gaiellaceae bacterium]